MLTRHSRKLFVRAMTTETKPPLPPFTRETAIQKVRMAENAWNSKTPNKVKQAYSPDTSWRNRDTFLKGRDEVETFLQGKWDREQSYRLIKELWSFSDNLIVVRFCYEYHNDQGNWFRAHGNENWLFDEHGLMKECHASINGVPIEEKDRKFHWETPDNARPEDYPELSELGL